MHKIGIDVRLTYYRRGGIAEYMRQLVAALGELDADCRYKTLHNFRARENLTPSTRFKRVNCYTPCHHRFESTALVLELLPHRLDLLHSPDFIPPRFGAKKYVITVHDLAFLLYRDIQTADSLRYYAGQIGRAVQQADHIISVSGATRDDLMRLLDVPADQISVIWEGVHPQFNVTEQEKFPGLPDGYILFVGTIEPRKNIPKLLEGYAILKKQHQNTPKLVLAGQKGWLWEKSFRAIDDSGLQNDVIWLDGVPFAALPALYKGAALHILPSLYEGFGFPPLEAMACGTPTIVSDRGALRETAGDAALYVDPDDPDSIADAMQRVLSDDDLRSTLREKGLRHVQGFSWHTTAEKTLAVYQKVLST